MTNQEDVIDNIAVKIYEIKEVASKQIPSRISAIKDLLGIDNDDTVLTILRHFNYSE